MITIFNRRELCVARSIEAQQNICDCLNLHGIEYRCVIVDRNNYPNEITTKAAYENKEVLHRFYVNKKDYEQALHVIKDIKR